VWAWRLAWRARGGGPLDAPLLRLDSAETSGEIFAIFAAEWQAEMARHGVAETELRSTAMEDDLRSSLGKLSAAEARAAAAAAAAAPPRAARPRLWRALIFTCYRSFAIALILRLLWSVFMLLATSFFVQRMVAELSARAAGKRDDTVLRDGLLYCLGFFVDCTLMSLTMHQVNHQAVEMALRMRTALYEAILRKTLRLRDVASHRADALRLSTADVALVYEGALMFPFTFHAVLEAFAIVGVIFIFIGWPAVFACALLLGVVALLLWCGRRLQTLRQAFTLLSETRLRDFHESLSCIKQVKFYGWEVPLVARLRHVRLRERATLLRAGAVKATALAAVFALPPIVSLLMFGSLVALRGALDATVVFTTLSLFNTLRFPLLQLPRAVRACSSALAALGNISQFLLLEEVPGVAQGARDLRDLADGDGDGGDAAVAAPAAAAAPPPALQLTSEPPSISFSNASLQRFGTVLARNLNAKLPAGGLLAVVGPVGCGKTAVLSALMGGNAMRFCCDFVQLSQYPLVFLIILIVSVICISHYNNCIVLCISHCNHCIVLCIISHCNICIVLCISHCNNCICPLYFSL
jgi:ABC-type multidrug transport system fused ATPase/permease subunit